MKKRLIALLLVLCLVMLTACQTASGGDATSTPTPTESTAPTKAVEPTGSVAPTETATPTDSPAVTSTPEATPTEVTVAPTATAEPTATPEPIATETPAPTEEAGQNTPTPIDVAEQTTPAPTESVEPTPTETAQSTPAATGTPTPTTVVATATPTAAPTKEPTKVPTATEAPKPTATAVPKPTATTAPTATEVPKPTATAVPTATEIPKPTATPVPPTATSTPEPTATNTPTPTATNTPVPTKVPSPTPIPVSSKVHYSDEGCTDNSGTTVSNEVENSASIINKLVNCCYGMNGLGGWTSDISICSSYEEMMAAANGLAAYKGITSITIQKKAKYANLDHYILGIEWTASFIYHYAIQSGDTSKLNASENQTLQELKRLVQEAKQYSTEFEKEKFFHDYLVKNVTYGIADSTRGGQTAYEALILKTSVCNGYASSFELLLTLSGIECTFVTGTSQGQNHAWNQAKIDGEWYNVDVTWDHQNGDSTIYYNYFNVTDAVLNQDHTASSSEVYPCISLRYNGLKMAYINLATQEEVNAYVLEQKNAGVTNIEFLYTGNLDKNTIISGISNTIYSGFNYYFNPNEVGTYYQIIL